MTNDIEITISAEEPPANGTNVSVRYARGARSGVFSLSSIAEAVAKLNEALEMAQPSQDMLMAGGRALFDALFSGRILEALRESLLLANERNQGVCLRLYSEIPSIIAIPWEYLYDPEQERWLALHPDLSIVRALPLAVDQPTPVEGALRVLVMFSSPSDLSPLDSAQEWTNLNEATAVAAIELVRVEPTYAALQAALRQPAHVFHFVGHGAFDEEGRQGFLAFQGEDGAAELVTADKLSVLLAACKTLRLVFLNACQGAVTGARSAFAGVAQRLIQQGVPAVIAMQAPILDDHALRFSQEFYRALADGLGVAQAVGEGRKRINQVACTWGIPAFYFQGIEPFAVRPLSDIDKAARLWQKVQASLTAPPGDEAKADDKWLRSALNQILALDPAHDVARHRLQRLDNEATAAKLYTEGLAALERQRWRDAHRALEEVERLYPNYGDTRSRLAEVLGKLDGGPPLAPSSERRRKIHPILNAVEEGRFVPFLGCDAARFGRPAHDSWVRGQYPPDTGEIAHELAKRLGSPIQGLPSLIHVSQLTSLLEDDVVLFERLYDLYTINYPPTMLHRLLAELPGRLWKKEKYPKRPGWRLVIFSTAFDDLMERAFDEARQPYHLFAYRPRSLNANGVAQAGRFVHIPPGGEPVEMPEPNIYRGHDGNPYPYPYPLIVKLCGLRITPEPNSVVVTEDQYLEYLPGQEIGALLPATLLNQVKNRMFVFLGCSSQEWHFRLLWQRMKYQNDSLHARGWAILSQPSEIEMKFWDRLDKNIDPLVIAPEEAMAYVNEWLDTL
jgi:hypothetical protein